MAKAEKTDKAPSPEPKGTPEKQPWAGTGLCPEAQGDGVPCFGTEGECERCGRALPPTPSGN